MGTNHDKSESYIGKKKRKQFAKTHKISHKIDLIMTMQEFIVECRAKIHGNHILGSLILLNYK
jgi:hypothetical protein